MTKPTNKEIEDAIDLAQLFLDGRIIGRAPDNMLRVLISASQETMKGSVDIKSMIHAEIKQLQNEVSAWDVLISRLPSMHKQIVDEMEKK
jgi:hypothetical protein